MKRTKSGPPQGASELLILKVVALGPAVGLILKCLKEAPNELVA
jgi:hypothetical protein